jgi:hypothetical protein
MVAGWASEDGIVLDAPALLCIAVALQSATELSSWLSLSSRSRNSTV